jgi:hypothetical protein
VNSTSPQPDPVASTKHAEKAAAPKLEVFDKRKRHGKPLSHPIRAVCSLLCSRGRAPPRFRDLLYKEGKQQDHRPDQVLLR